MGHIPSSNAQTRETSEEDSVQVIINGSSVSEPPSKRQKLEPQYSSYSSTNNAVFDPRKEEYTVTRPHKSQRKSQAFSNRSPTPGIEQSVDPRHGVSEYTSLEKKMHVEPPQTRKSRHRRSNKNLRSDNAPTVPAHLLDSDPIQDTSEPEVQDQGCAAVFRHKHMGIARLPQALNLTTPGTSEFREQRKSGTRSQNLVSLPSRRSLEIHNVESFTSNWQEGQENYDKKLNEEFRTVDGLRRSDFPVVDQHRTSPDELAGETTIGNNNNFIREHQPDASRRKSPVKPSSVQKGDAFCHTTDGLPPSNIPPTLFTSLKNKNNKKKTPNHPTTHNGEKEAPWSIELEAVSAGGQKHESGNLGLVFDQNTKAFDVRQDGLSLTTKYPDLHIYPKKVQKIIHSLESTKVRVESSKCGNRDNTLDIQTCSPKRAYDLVMKLCVQSDPKTLKRPRYVLFRLDCKLKLLSLI